MKNNKVMSTKDKILMTAIKMFAEYSYDAVSMRCIANKTGVNSHSLFYYFGSKLELYRACVDTLLENDIKSMESIREDIKFCMENNLNLEVWCSLFKKYLSHTIKSFIDGNRKLKFLFFLRMKLSKLHDGKIESRSAETVNILKLLINKTNSIRYENNKSVDFAVLRMVSTLNLLITSKGEVLSVFKCDEYNAEFIDMFSNYLLDMSKI
ncbi:MAG: TetR/AcrR family transcriptional regulator [bacterium]|nr:TetR/AcrR family transcriptional regulator [bacterium]